MKIYKNLNKINNLKNTVIAIGNFDGIHLGHQKVLIQAKSKAKKEKLKFGVVSFEPMPIMFFNNKIKNHRINNLNQKVEGFRKLQLDFLVNINFNKKFSNLSYKKFISQVINKNLKSKFLFISKNFKFGKNRKGDIKKLIQNELFFNYKTLVLKPLRKKNKVLSSTIIRNEIRKGNIETANKYLGRNWTIEGKVIKGDQRGRKIGFPTCNILLKDYIVPKAGVYSVYVRAGQIKKPGIANIGFRPTFNGKTLLLEVNIFGLKANLYNKKLQVSFKKFIRGERKFKNIRQLKIQIEKDIIQAKKK